MQIKQTVRDELTGDVTSLVPWDVIDVVADQPGPWSYVQWYYMVAPEGETVVTNCFRAGGSSADTTIPAFLADTYPGAGE